VGDNQSIGVFAAKREQDTAIFFGYDDQSLVARLYESASTLAKSADLPITDAGRARRIGKLSLQAVEDEASYIVQPIEMPDTGRKPSGDVGTWAVQSLVFNKDIFTLEQAKTWISEHSDNFGYYGHDETDTSYRFRQHDPEYFDEFRTAALTDGIAAVYGKIAESTGEQEAAKAAIEESLEKHYAVRKINQSILKQGVRILCGTASSLISKGSDGVEKEERFVLSMVLEPNDGADGAPYKPDTQKDVYSAADVRKACHVWMEYYGAIDLMHSWNALGKQDVRTLECFVAPCDFQNGDDKVIKGSWMLGIRVANDDLWKAVQSGDLGAYSIGGTASRVPLEAA
jgi:hypothetical protein